VPIVLAGEAREVEMRHDGTVDHLLFTPHGQRQAGRHPQRDRRRHLRALDVGDHVSVGDLNLPAGVTTDVDVDEAVVVTTGRPASEAEPAEGEPPRAGEPTPAAEPAEGDAEG
jgi:hypothetical protein